MRIDKYIWAVRLAKTRSLAAKLCASEKVKLNDEFTKAAKSLKVGDLLQIKDVPVWRSYKVLDFPKSRVGAKLVPEYTIEMTSEEDLNLIHEVAESNRQNRFLGLRGRPTKRERRKLDRFNPYN